MKRNLLTSVISFVLLMVTATVSTADIYTGSGGGGFGGTISGSTLELTYDSGTDVVSGRLDKGAGDFNDSFVLYLDTAVGGFADTSTFDDEQDSNRRAISGSSGSGDSDVVFNAGFDADFAIALSPVQGSFGGLWGLASGGNNSLNYVSSVNLSPLSNNAPFYTFSFDLADIGLSVGDSFDFVGTYLNADNSFRSDEYYGSATTAGNPGQATFTFTDNLSFTAVPEPSSLALMTAFGVGVVAVRRRRK